MTRGAGIGTAGGGKSTMARALAAAHGLPSIAVDTLQWRPGWTPVPRDEFTRLHDDVLATDAWVSDGVGPWAAVEKRFDQADTIILVDHPLWVHVWWAAERQIACVTAERPDGPDGCPMLPMTDVLFKMIGDIHHEARPRLLDMIERRRADTTVVPSTSPDDLNRFVAEQCRPVAGAAAPHDRGA